MWVDEEQRRGGGDRGLYTPAEKLMIWVPIIRDSRAHASNGQPDEGECSLFDFPPGSALYNLLIHPNIALSALWRSEHASLLVPKLGMLKITLLRKWSTHGLVLWRKLFPGIDLELPRSRYN